MSLSENSSRGTHVPRETQEFLRKELLGDFQESQEMESAWSSPEGPDEALMRTEGNGHPAAWVGKDGEAITIVCRGKACKDDEPKWDLSLREPMYEDGDRALVGISGENGGYGGDIVFRADLDGELLSAARIVDRQKAVDGGKDGIEMLSKGKGAGLFERFLDEHPSVAHVFDDNVEYDCSAFVSDGSSDQPIPVFVRTEDNVPAAWTGGGALNDKTKGVVACSGDLDLREPLEVRGESGCVSLHQALVQVDQNDLIFRVDGRLPLERGNLSLNVEAVRVEDPWAATSPDGKGTVQVKGREAKHLFFQLLDEHPEIKHALQHAHGGDGSAFAGSEGADPEHPEGTVKWFDRKRNYGFLIGENEKDIFFHASDVKGDILPSEGDRVKFAPVSSEEGLAAEDVEVIGTSRETGTVKWFDEGKGYGFLEPDESDEDAFVHISEIEGGAPSDGARVEFTPDRTEKGLKALDARVL